MQKHILYNSWQMSLVLCLDDKYYFSCIVDITTDISRHIHIQFIALIFQSAESIIKNSVQLLATKFISTAIALG